jgi:hypothetical protein
MTSSVPAVGCMPLLDSAAGQQPLLTPYLLLPPPAIAELMSTPAMRIARDGISVWPKAITWSDQPPPDMTAKRPRARHPTPNTADKFRRAFINYSSLNGVPLPKLITAHSREPYLSLRNLTPGITRRPERLQVHENYRVGVGCMPLLCCAGG